MFAAKHIAICLYLVSSSLFGDAVCLLGHTFIDGTHSIMEHG